MSNIVEPRSLPGVMELLPNDQVLFDEMKKIIEDTYKSYGFLPIDTPVIERAEVLLAKAGGETEKQIYEFKKGDTDICLRFDLTVPLAKYVSANFNELEFPFKRYQIAKVYRGEKAQKGRYREFYQCDIDIIGKDNLSIKNDAECVGIIYSIFKKLNLGEFVVQMNNRKIVNGLLKALNLYEKREDVMHIVDKFKKIGEENVRLTLKDLGISDETINKLISFVSLKGSNDEILEKLKAYNIDNEEYTQGVNELNEVINTLRLQNVPDKYFVINPVIVRGLDYYTGTVFETILTEHESLGSVCGGGRYENLAGFYTDEKLPGVGISIGLTRLFFQLKESGLLEGRVKQMSKLLVLPMDESALKEAYKVANILRENGISTQVYYEDKKFKNKMSYADKLQFNYAVILGEDEVNNGYITLKDMINHTQEQLSLEEAVNKLKK